MPLDEQGFDIVAGALPSEWVASLRDEAACLARAEPGCVQGVRDLMSKSALVRKLLCQLFLRALVAAGHGCVRGILFDKTPGANWLVAWHQDLTIAVAKQQEVSGYGPWSVKHGVPHVQPPAELLACMITLRLHLDETHKGNGALRVIPGSHREGKLDAEAVAKWRFAQAEVVCEASPGDVLRMRPLLLHASSKAVHPGHRRVIHLEFASRSLLPKELRWHENEEF